MSSLRRNKPRSHALRGNALFDALRRVHMAELPDDLCVRIRILSQEGDALAANRDYTAALERYWAVWDLLPEPQTVW